MRGSIALLGCPGVNVTGKIREGYSPSALADRLPAGWRVASCSSSRLTGLVMRKDGPFRNAEFDRRGSVTVHGRTMRLVSPEDLLLSKLLWGADSGSAVQFDDAKQLAALQLDWTYVELWAAALNLTESVERLRQ